ncbi:MAG TPA: ABC transporter substrate-binding protein [Ramlibacter sp.]|nr:ABC transporter substrate-binding protein [Ramlibacter sp.]
MNWRKSALVLGSALLVAASSGAAEIGVTDNAIKIGVHAALTGPASFVGQGGKVGIDAAVAEINGNGGVNGRKLEIVYVDDRGSPDGGVSAVRRLVDDDKVFAVFGAGPSASTVSVVPLFQQNGVPYLVSFASDPRVLEKFTPNIYSGATVPQLDAIGSYADFMVKDLKAKRVAMMVCDQPHCTSSAPILKGLLEKSGVHVTVSTYNTGDTDFTGQISQIKSATPDVIFLFGLAPDEGRIIPGIKRSGLPQPIVTDVSGSDLTVLRMAGPAAEGYYTFWFGGPQFYDDTSGAMGKFLASIRANKIERPANTPNLYTLMAYADIYVLAEAIRVGGKDVTRAGLLKSLDNSIKGFVPAAPNWGHAASIGSPRTFSATNHKGTTGAQPVVVKGGTFKPAR